MKRINRILPIIALAAGLAVLQGCAPYSTGSTEVGVRTVKWSLFGEKGVQDHVYQPGATHWFVPFVTDWDTFDTRLHNLEMTEAAGKGARVGPDELRFKTIDGNDIGLDVIISYKIIPEKAPYILQHVATNDTELEEAIVRTITRSKPRDIFGELRTEDFYVAAERTEKAEEVADKLNEILEPYGVEITRVGTRDYRFNKQYQAAIEDKKVADQEAEKLKAETRAVEEEYLMKVEKAKAETETIRAKANGEYERAVIEADAYYEQQIRIAEAVLAEGKAEAEAITEMNRALSGPGGKEVVKLEIADSLNGKPLIMLPMGGGMDIRSTDINGLLEMYGIKSLGQSNKRPPATSPIKSKPTSESGRSAGTTPGS